MKPPPHSEEFDRFTDAMQHIMRVPKTAVKRPKENGKQPKSSASRVSAESSKRVD